MIYLSGADNAHLRAVAGLDVGIMTTPDIGYTPSSVSKYRYWAADNACFAHGDTFSMESYVVWLRKFDPSTCLFATAPDVVGDWDGTLKRAASALPILRDLGYRAAIVLQDGATVDSVPWGSIDAVFVGGTTEWKLSQAAESICREAKRRGKWAHMGRVNSARRFEIARQMGCDSVDGTFLAFGPEKNLRRMLRWLESEAQQTLF